MTTVITSYQVACVECTHNICAAHRLLGHPGKCANLHGHNYKVTLELTKAEIDQDKDGMILDFSEIKNVVFAFIDNLLDHKVILQETDPLVAALQNVVDPNSILVVPYRPTVEMLAGYLLFYVDQFLVQTYQNSISLLSVQMEETPGNKAIVRNIYMKEEEEEGEEEKVECVDEVGEEKQA